MIRCGARGATPGCVSGRSFGPAPGTCWRGWMCTRRCCWWGRRRGMGRPTTAWSDEHGVRCGHGCGGRAQGSAVRCAPRPRRRWVGCESRGQGKRKRADGGLVGLRSWRGGDGMGLEKPGHQERRINQEYRAQASGKPVSEHAWDAQGYVPTPTNDPIVAPDGIPAEAQDSAAYANHQWNSRVKRSSVETAMGSSTTSSDRTEMTAEDLEERGMGLSSRELAVQQSGKGIGPKGLSFN